MRNSILSTWYKSGNEGKYTIELSLDSPASLFNPIDGANSTYRDVSKEVRLFLHGSLKDIGRAKVENIIINIKSKIDDGRIVHQMIKNIYAHFNLEKHLLIKIIKKKFLQAILLLLGSLIALLFAMNSDSENWLIHEGFTLFGWVLGWNGLAKLFFEIPNQISSIYNLKGLIAATVEIKSL